MSYGRAAALVACVAVVNVAVALGAWWALTPPVTPVVEPAAAPASAPARAEAPDSPPSLAVQRLAELVSGAAFRAVITYDYAGLNDLVRRAAAWPEVTYLSVEDVQGKVIAHSDPARVGRPGGAGPAADRAPAAGSHQEVTVSLAGPEIQGKAGAQLGQVRLGYVVDEPTRAAAPIVAAPAPPPARRDPRFPLAAILGAAALAALPIGAGLAWLASRGAGPGEPPAADLKRINNLRQARITIAHWMREADAARADAASQRAETERLAHALAERTAALARAESVREAIDREAATWAGERASLHAELRARDEEIEDARVALQARMREADDAGRSRLFLEAELVDLREEVQAARGALAGRPLASRDLAEQELVQHRHRVIAYVSRAIRSSLTSVLGFSKLLLRGADGPLNEAQRTSVANVHEAGDRLLRVVNDLSDFSQVEAGTLELRDEVVDVAAVLREVASAAPSVIGRDAGAVAIECPASLPPVRGNQRRLVQLLLGVLHAPDPEAAGPTALSVRVDDDALAFVVTHRGSRIPCEDLATLFDPFAPVDGAGMLEDDGRRLRLGLARALCTTIGGRITAEALEDVGIVFTVTVPVAADVEAVA